MFILTVLLNIAKELNPLSENVYTDLSNSIFQIFKMYMNSIFLKDFVHLTEYARSFSV